MELYFGEGSFPILLAQYVFLELESSLSEVCIKCGSWTSAILKILMLSICSSNLLDFCFLFIPFMF